MLKRIVFAVPSIYLLINAANSTTWFVHLDSSLNSIEAASESCMDHYTVLVGISKFVKGGNMKYMIALLIMAVMVVSVACNEIIPTENAERDIYLWGVVYSKDSEPVGTSFEYVYVYLVETGYDEYDYTYYPSISTYETDALANAKEYGIYACYEDAGSQKKYYSQAHYVVMPLWPVELDLYCEWTTPPVLKHGNPD